MITLEDTWFTIAASRPYTLNSMTTPVKCLSILDSIFKIQGLKGQENVYNGYGHVRYYTNTGFLNWPSYSRLSAGRFQIWHHYRPILKATEDSRTMQCRGVIIYVGPTGIRFIFSDDLIAFWVHTFRFIFCNTWFTSCNCRPNTFKSCYLLKIAVQSFR